MPVTIYEYDINGEVVEEHDENGNVLVEYTRESDGTLISEHRNGVDRFYHYDGAGNTLALTDINGDVTDTFAYNASGEVTARTGTTETPFQYKGQHGYYWDDDVGDFMVGRRPLDPSQGRWLTPDPLGILDDRNLYRYARNNPIMFIDPTGLSPTCGEEKKKTLSCQEFLKLLKDRNKDIGVLSDSFNVVFKCNVDIYCGTCQGFDAYTWIDPKAKVRWGHICFNEKKNATLLDWLSAFLHESFHFVQVSAGACNKTTPFPPGRPKIEPPPQGAGNPSKATCKACKKHEEGSYERQANFVFSGTGCDKIKAMYVEWGLCYSCQHVCINDDPCNASIKWDKLTDELAKTPGCKQRTIELPDKKPK